MRAFLRMQLARRRMEERGVAAVILAVFVAAVMVPLGGLVVDIGMQRVSRSDAQATADSIALDLARQVGADASTIAAGAADSSVPTNGRQYTTVSNEERGLLGSGVTAHVWQGYVDPQASASSFRSNQARGCGGTQPYDGYFQPIPAGKTPNAVDVTVSSNVGFHFYPGQSGAVCRSAVAEELPRDECYKVSSYALGLDTKNSILGPLLGVSNISTQVLSSQGIATAEVSLLGLATQLGVGTPTQLLTDPALTIGQFIAASVDVLNASGNTASASALQSLAVDLGSLTGQKMDLAELIDLGQGNSSALDADVNIGDLLTGALLGLQAANKSNAAALGITLPVPGVGTLTATATVVAPPVIGCNGGEAKAAQVDIDLSGGSGSLGIPLVASFSNFHLAITLANATAVDDPTVPCSTDSMTLKVSDQTLANIRLTADLKAVLNLIPLASLDTGAPSSTTATYNLSVPGSYTTPVQTGSGSLGIDLSHSNVVLLGFIDLGSLTSALQPLLDAVSNLVTQTLAPILGLTVAGADLYAVPPTPTCGVPKLVG